MRFKNRRPFIELVAASRLSVIGGLDYWNGLLEWTLTFFFFFFYKS